MAKDSVLEAAHLQSLLLVDNISNTFEQIRCSLCGQLFDHTMSVHELDRLDRHIFFCSKR